MPQKYKLQYLTSANQDITQIVQFHIAQVGSASARKIYKTLRTELLRLKVHPYLGRMHSDPELALQGYRELVLTKIYVAIYKVIDDTVFIYRVVNGATDYPKLLK